MHPEEATRQMADVIDANSDASGSRHAAMYSREFERVAAEGSTEDVSERPIDSARPSARAVVPRRRRRRRRPTACRVDR